MMKSMKTTRLIVMYTVPLDYHKDLTYEEKEHKWGILQFLFGFIKILNNGFIYSTDKGASI